MILVVDDDTEARTLLAVILREEGYSVRVADSGRLALASAAVRVPELVLLDIRMPEMDGFEVFRRFRDTAETRNVPVMFLTAGNAQDERLEGLRMGAVDFLAKPFQREELLARVRTHLELHRLRVRLEEHVAARTAELRESEQRFRNMADAAPVMIWASGTDKRCTFFNKGWLEFTGRTSQEECGDGWTAGVHPQDRDAVIRKYESAFNARRTFELEYRLRRADGEYRWVLDRGTPLFQAGGAFAGYIGSCFDISDHRQQQERLLATQKLESLGVMAAGVAHDFGNFLGNIQAAAEVALLDLSQNAPARKELERIETVVEYARETVNLLMASAGAGGHTDASEFIDLSDFVERILRVLPAAMFGKAVVQTNLTSGLPRICAIPAQIRQVVMNLITNASESLDGSAGTITVTIDRSDVLPAAGSPEGSADAGYVCLKVADTGSGMSADTRAKMFDQFFTTKAQGRGLGLSAVHGIVRSYGGYLTVESAPGQGSTFEVFFPACINEAGLRRYRRADAGGLNPLVEASQDSSNSDAADPRVR